MVSQKVVTPVKTGVQSISYCLKTLDSGFRRNDEISQLLVFSENTIFNGFTSGINNGILNMGPLAKVPRFVTPVKTGVQNPLNSLDTGFRRYDGIGNM